MFIICGTKVKKYHNEKYDENENIYPWHKVLLDIDNRVIDGYRQQLRNAGQLVFEARNRIL